MLATETATYMPPLPAALAVLPTPELMAIVMRRVGPGCSLDDFNEAAETCDIGEPRLRANLGAAKRILMMETERQVFPARPLAPWDADPTYREELVRNGGRIVALGMADTAAIVAQLERNNFDPHAMCALWDDIIGEAIRQVHDVPHVAPLARIIADLDAALDAYDRPGNNAEARQLTQSMRVALQAMRGEATIGRHHVVATVNAFASTLEFADFNDRADTERVKAALVSLRKIWGLE